MKVPENIRMAVEDSHKVGDVDRESILIVFGIAMTLAVWYFLITGYK